MWNELPRKLVTSENINTFKNNLDKHLENHPNKYNHKTEINVKSVEE